MKESRFYQEIQQEGAVDAIRKGILAVLRRRFKDVPLTDIEAALGALEDLAQLESLLLEAATCQAPDEFRAALARQPASA
jgi:hypothetical protein